MVLPNTTQLGYWVTALDYGGRPPFAYLRETMLMYDRELNKPLYTGHEQIPDRLWVKSFRTRHQALLWASWNAVELERALTAEPAELAAILEKLRQN